MCQTCYSDVVSFLESFIIFLCDMWLYNSVNVPLSCECDQYMILGHIFVTICDCDLCCHANSNPKLQNRKENEKKIIWEEE